MPEVERCREQLPARAWMPEVERRREQLPDSIDLGHQEIETLMLVLVCVYPNQYSGSMKPVRFLGDSLKCLREFPCDARHDVGRQLERVQCGKPPTISSRCH